MIEPSSLTPLVSNYKTHREADGALVLMMPWPGRSLLGCAVPTAIVAVGAWLIAHSAHADGMYGLSVMAVLFAAIVIPLVIYQSSHEWVLRSGFIKRATTLGARHWPHPDWLPARSVVLKRELWPDDAGSTDSVFVTTDQKSPLKVVSVYNWDGSESRLGSGGKGSLARSGPTVPGAPAPLAHAADVNLKSCVSEAVREIADLIVLELGVPLAYACDRARRRPDDVD